MYSLKPAIFLRLLCFVVFGALCYAAHADTIDMQQWEAGKALFKSNCASCHSPLVAQTGPALNGVTQRWQQAGAFGGKTGKEWLYSWIKNWNDPVTAGYPYAVKMQNYAPSQMNVFPYLTDKEIYAILLYAENPAAGNTAKVGAGKPETPVWSYVLPIILLVLVIIAYVVLQAINSKNNKLKGL